VTYVDKDYSASNGGAGTDDGAPQKDSALRLELRTAASTVVIATIRTVAADLAARADFDLDSIDDLRMAVDDLCAMLVRVAPADATLRCRFTAHPERIVVAADVEVEDGTEPPPTRSFGWRVLECLADEVSAEALPRELGQPSRICITVMKNAVTAHQP
jgi:serine/threonine-protein kinase RsbW